MSRGRHFTRSGAQLKGTLSNWISQIVHARTAEAEKRKIANRAWDLYLNDAMANGVLNGLVAEAVNTGLTPQPHPMTEWLGKTSEWQTEYQKKSYSLFEIWGLDFRNFPDATGRCNIYMLQSLALFLWKLEGIAVFQIIYSNDKTRPLGLSVLPIDSGRLVTPSDAKQGDIYDGIELGKNGEIKAAHFLKPDKVFSQYSAKASDCDRIKAVNKDGLPNLLFVCDVRNVSEYRQDSIISPMIKEIRDSNDIVDAVVVKYLIQNLWTAIVNSSRGADENGLSGQTASDRIQEVDKGTFIFADEEEEMKFLESNSPGQSYEIVNNSIMSRLGMATGRGSENVAKSYKASYSASQASIENARKFDDCDRMVLTNRFCQPLHTLMQYEAALRGILPVDSIDHFKANLYAYTRTDWMPPPHRPIDVNKAAKGDTERLSNHTTTYSDIYGGTGADWRKKMEQRAIELRHQKDLEKKYGVTFTPEPATEEGDIEGEE